MSKSEKKPHVLNVGGMKEIRTLVLAENCRLTWFITHNPKIDFSRNPEYQQILIFDPDTSRDQLVATAVAMHRFDPFERICSFHDESQLLTIEIAEAIGLPYEYSRATIVNTRDKYKMRACLERSGIDQIGFALVGSVAEVERFFGDHPEIDRAVLKPVDGTGSLNVRAVGRAEVHEAGTAAGLAFPLLIEEFVAGDEYSVETFTHEGQHHVAAVTEKFKHGETFLECGHLVPARIEEALEKEIGRYVGGCLTALGVAAGPCHSEVIVSGPRITLIETHTRVGGDCIPDLVKHATGIDLYRLTALRGIGKPLSPDAFRRQHNARHACIRYRVQQGSEGVISAIAGVDEVSRWPQVKGVSVEYKVGDKLPPVKHSFDRAASVLVVEADPERALSRADEALSRIEFKLQGDRAH